MKALIEKEPQVGSSESCLYVVFIWGHRGSHVILFSFETESYAAVLASDLLGN